MTFHKQLIAPLIAVLLPFLSNAQNVGIGTTSPSEILQVDSTIKIGKNNAIPTGSTRKNLLKFGDANYVSIGEEVVDDKMYIRYGNLVFLKSDNSVGSGYIGINTESPTAQLDVNGTIRIRSNAGDGKLLTSDAFGNATWQSQPAPAQYAFSGYVSTDLGLANGIEVVVAPYTEEFDDGNIFNPTTGIFTVPADGVYQIGYNMAFSETGTDLKSVTIHLKRNGNFWKSFFHITPGTNSNYSSSFTNSVTAKLTAGQQFNITLSRYAAAGNNLKGGNFSSSSFFSVVRLY